MHRFWAHTVIRFFLFFFTNYAQMSISEDDNEYEPSIRSLDTSDESASSSDNGYSLSSEEEEDGRIWCRHMVLEECMLPPPPRFPFTGNPGISIDQDTANITPLDFFSLLCDNRIIDRVVDETNRFA
ncbi:hypothetical protein chiPu_0001375 [Chiloscyllium punctatum]|uniref:PiggyBac transposable element-derived protein domain-containing protein n=1 Tax=Chiloscyllium punctatum TaxID=137246 RepID=A0A401RXU3_CHIPU|nr:hypothetical protein [Chiloscyllium punctatum]